MPGGPDVPAAPSAAQTIKSQRKENIFSGSASQAGSNVNQITPYGSLNYTKIGTGPGGIPLYSAETKLSPAQQMLLNLLQGTQAEAGQAGQNLLVGAGYSDQPDFTTGTDSRVTERLQHQLGYLSPFFDQQNESLEAQLRNQGLFPGMEAYDKALNNLRQSQGQQVNSFLATAQPEAFRQSVQEWQLPADMATKLAVFGSPESIKGNLVSTPGANYGAVDAAGITQSAFQNQMAQYEAEKAKYDAMISGIMGIGTSLVGMPFGGPMMSGLMGNSLVGTTVSGVPGGFHMGL